MKLDLGENFIVKSDANQYILCEKYKNNRELVLGYFSSIEACLKFFIDYKARTHQNIITAQQLIDYQNSLITGLNRALEPLKFEVTKKS
jgi:hypothetical protein